MDEVVVVSEAPPSTSFSEVRLICRVCQKQFSQYTCPRCNTRYCSLQCYKRHSLRCTESFMRENVMGELQHLQPEDETKRKMLEILKRFHSEDETNSDEEDESMLSEETIQKVISGNEIRVEDLSQEEIKQFQRAVASGELSKMIEPWNPWWKQRSAQRISLSPDGSRLIRPLHEQNESNLSEVPAGPENPLPPLSKLSQASPSPLLAVHLVDILYSYCFTLRLYNGDWHADPLGAATEVLTLSAVLSDDARPETVAEALSSCLEKICSPMYRHTGGFPFGIGIIDDVNSLLSLGGNALICLLSDLRMLIQAGEGMIKSEMSSKGKRSGSSRKLKGAERKAYFLMCWVHEQPGEAWSSLASLVEVEKASILAVNRGRKKPGTAEEKDLSRSKVLIEEF
ncbi:zinc finger HIT domain-containing protein 2 [Iris pallida]|uniref:Zinc finger HIT domain-containing protein 2 n=1 Tax=Iris pallida TaxID=29817 RepID=A0AAX6H477_IRIPA|nr:zinc finger HIT domain-containing protein 2 [Iris pallida]